MIAIIYFSDGTSIGIHEDDRLTPIVSTDEIADGSASMGKSISVYYHTNNGLIPSLMDCFTHCSFFYLNNDYSTVYSTNSIVRIVTDMY